MQSNKKLALLALALSSLSSNGIADDKDKFDAGKREYMNRCAVCHGQSGKGDGGAIDILKATPSDLTSLTKKNGGVFPFDRVYAVIDGRQVVKGHGTRDMPIWGKEYSAETAKADEYFGGMPYNMDMYVRSRILALIDYLNRIQSK
jgi:mono/diheme cytochrome c family protein